MKTKEEEYMFTNKWICVMLRKSRRLHTCNYIHMKNIRCLNLLDGYIEWFSSKEKKNEMAREQRGKYIYIYNGTITTKKKKRNKQETDYNKILVGARTWNRKN